MTLEAINICIVKVDSMKFKTETRNYYSLLVDIVYIVIQKYISIQMRSRSIMLIQYEQQWAIIRHDYDKTKICVIIFGRFSSIKGLLTCRD